MKKTTIVLTALLMIIEGFSVQNEGIGRRNAYAQSSVLEILAISFVVGNVVAWSMGAYPRNFDEIPYDAEEQETKEELESYLVDNPEDDVILTEYGALLVKHNELDKAEEILDKALQINERQAVTLAWASANQFKLSGRMFDLSWGIAKLIKFSDAEEMMESAVAKSPENLLVRLIRLNVYAGVGNLVEKYDQLCDEKRLFETELDNGALRHPSALALASYHASNPPCLSSSKNKRLAQGFLDKADKTDISEIDKKKIASLKIKIEKIE